MIGTQYSLEIEGFYENGNFKTKIISFQRGKNRIVTDQAVPSVSLTQESNVLTIVRAADNHSQRFVELIYSENVLPKILLIEERTFRGNIVKREIISFSDVQVTGYARRNYASNIAEDTFTFYTKENQWRYV